MSDALGLISRHGIREAKQEDCREHLRQSTPLLRSDKPGTLVFYAFANAEGTEVKIIHAFPDAVAIDASGGRSRAVGTCDGEFFEPRSFEIYGQPSEAAMAIMRQAAQGGSELVLYPEPLESCVGPPRAEAHSVWRLAAAAAPIRS